MSLLWLIPAVYVAVCLLVALAAKLVRAACRRRLERRHQRPLDELIADVHREAARR